MTEKEIYCGEDFGILLRLTNAQDDTPTETWKCDFEATLYNTHWPSNKIIASTAPGAQIPIQRRDDGVLVINISGQLTSKLTPGELAMELSKTDRASNKTEIIASNLLRIKESNRACR